MTENKKIVLRDTHFESTTIGHGGNRRTKQIEEILQKASINIIDIQSFKKKSLRDKLKILLGNFIDVIGITFRLFPFWKNAFTSIIKSHQIKSVLGNKESEKLIIWEDSLNFYTIYQARKKGFKIIAIPHNFDSLGLKQKPNSNNFSKNFNFLEKEIMCFFKSDAVFCISREEQWFLRACGLDSQYLPYYPPDSILNKLLEIRSKRIQNQDDINHKQKKWLVLGTYNNPPTKLGMIELVNWLKEINEVLSIEISVAGYGTEKMEEEIEFPPSFNLLGSLTDEDLDKIIIESKGIIIHQKYGLGALTKIPEMLIAGVPIIGNSIASRSYYDYDGLYTYENKSQLANFLPNSFPIPPIPPRLIDCESRFIEYVHRLLS